MLTSAALSTKDEPAEHRHVVVQGNHVAAVRTRGARGYDRLAAGQPVDAHVQEAAPAQPEGKGRDCKEEFHVLAKCRFHLDLNDYKTVIAGPSKHEGHCTDANAKSLWGREKTPAGPLSRFQFRPLTSSDTVRPALSTICRETSFA